MKSSMAFAALMMLAFLGAPFAAAAQPLPAGPAAALDLEKVLPCPPQSALKADAGFTCPQMPALQKRDYQAVLDAQKNASAAEKALAIADAARPSAAQFLRPLWARLANPQAPSCKTAVDAAAAADDGALAAILPATVGLFREMSKTSRAASDETKTTYGRTRPFDARIDGLPPIVPLLPVDNLKSSPSYPSGHTMFAYEAGVLLGRLLPEAQDIFIDRARQYGWHRVVAGAHFPTDVDAGATSGTLIVAAFMQDSAFHRKLAGASAELHNALCY
jgi:acid phosphatase (class A)